MKNSILCAMIFHRHMPVKIHQALMYLPWVRYIKIHLKKKYNDILYLSKKKKKKEPCLAWYYLCVNDLGESSLFILEDNHLWDKQLSSKTQENTIPSAREVVIKQHPHALPMGIESKLATSPKSFDHTWTLIL